MATPSLRDKIAEIFIKTDDFCNYFEHEFVKNQLSDSSATY